MEINYKSIDGIADWEMAIQTGNCNSPSEQMSRSELSHYEPIRKEMATNGYGIRSPSAFHTPKDTLVSDILYNLHKKVWTSSEIIPERLKIYGDAIDNYKKKGLDVREHKYYFSLYNYILRKEKK